MAGPAAQSPALAIRWNRSRYSGWMTGPMQPGSYPSGRSCQLARPDRREAFDDDPVGRHTCLVLDCGQPRLDPGEPGSLGLYLSLDLGPAQPEHAAQFRRAHLLLQDRLHLLQGEAKILQRDDAVQLGELARLIEAVSAGRLDAGWTEQPDRVVVPEHPDRDATVPRELTDTEHDMSRSTASHGVRVNPVMTSVGHAEGAHSPAGYASSDSARQAVVGGVPANLVLERARGRRFVYEQQFDAGDPGVVGERLGADRGGHAGVVRRAGRQPCGGRGREVRRGLPHRAADR